MAAGELRAGRRLEKMAKHTLEKAIQEAAEQFAMQIVEAVKKASLQELISLQETPSTKRRGRKPGPKPKGTKAAKKTAAKPGRPRKTAKKAAAAPAKKKRVVKNYPKCAYPGCDKNRFVRGKGFCGEHFKQFQAGEIKAASEYKK